MQVWQRRLTRIGLIVGATLLAADIVYKNVADISPDDRSRCIIYQVLPRFWFAVFENFFELLVLVLLGIFIAALLERYFSRIKWLMPTSPVTAFAYASLVPVCACAALPIVATLRDRLHLRTLITFVVAAPLVNPYIVVLSFEVLGWEYAMLRIASAFALAVSAGYVLELFHKRVSLGATAFGCGDQGCGPATNDLLLKTYSLFRTVMPYLLIAGVIGVGFEYMGNTVRPLLVDIGGTWWGSLVLILGGMPIYFCHGSDVLLLRPLVHNGLPLGGALAFSLTSTAICLASAFMLMKFMGRWLTGVLILHIIGCALLISVVVNALLPMQ